MVVLSPQYGENTAFFSSFPFGGIYGQGILLAIPLEFQGKDISHFLWHSLAIKASHNRYGFVGNLPREPACRRAVIRKRQAIPSYWSYTCSTGGQPRSWTPTTGSGPFRRGIPHATNPLSGLRACTKPSEVFRFCSGNREAFPKVRLVQP